MLTSHQLLHPRCQGSSSTCRSLPQHQSAPAAERTSRLSIAVGAKRARKAGKIFSPGTHQSVRPLQKRVAAVSAIREASESSPPGTAYTRDTLTPSSPTAETMESCGSAKCG
ncbi:hypothetical protein CUR178_06723 [Leishmania enriettii]|uniref:Uncharacterized protein n=1 Tax=Leishmania enriettii TaxID=5663 RepID=A0A836GWQ8_LEIEN|nr:hypothetical protein CUR178_06723 [Leishmania enriettii]